MAYKRILLALELDPDTDVILVRKAKALAETFGASLAVIHAVEQLSNYGAAYGISAGIDIEEELVKEARRFMADIGVKMGIAPDHQIVNIGPAKMVIIHEANQRNADLIIVGSHGRHGIQLLLGSTANAVLHGANCDILAFRIKED